MGKLGSKLEVSAQLSACTRRKVSSFPDGVGRGGRHRTYAEPGVGRFGESVAVSGRFSSGFPHRTSESGPNRQSLGSHSKVSGHPGQIQSTGSIAVSGTGTLTWDSTLAGGTLVLSGPIDVTGGSLSATGIHRLMELLGEICGVRCETAMLRDSCLHSSASE